MDNNTEVKSHEDKDNKESNTEQKSQLNETAQLNQASIDNNTTNITNTMTNQTEDNQIPITSSTNDNTQDPSQVFQCKLKEILSTQDDILQMTLAAKEKFHSVNEITQDQINTFKQNTQKYGKYLTLIKNELQTIAETIHKIKKLKK